MPQLTTFDAVARAAVIALGAGIVESAVLAGFVFLAIRLSRPSATTRHVLWWLVLVASAALPAVSIGASLRHIEHHTVGAAAQTESTRVTVVRTSAHAEKLVVTKRIVASVPAPAARAVRDDPSSGAPAANDIAKAASTFAAVGALPHIASALLALWFLVAATGLFALARGLEALRRTKRAAEPLDESVLRRLRRWRHSTRMGRPVAVSVSNSVDVPVAVGFRTPTILLPARVVEVEAIADIDQIAMHEYAHLNRYDDWTNLVQLGIERIFWFNPVVALVGRRISLEREIACDDWVIAQTGRAHRYASCLWKLVEASRLPATAIVAPGALMTPRQITIRIEQLLDARRNAVPRLSPFGALAVGTLCALVIGVQATRAPAIALVDAAPVAAPRAAAVIAPKAAATAAAHAAHVAAHVAAHAAAHTAAHAADRAASVAAGAEGAALTAVAADAAALGARIGSDAARRVASQFVNGAPETQPEIPANGRVDRAWLERCSLGCDGHGVGARGLDLHGIALTDVDLAGADFRGANLRDARLTSVNLRAARLDGADLRGAIFTGSDLARASLSGANLDGARLIGTSLHGADTSGTRLRSLIDRCEGCDLRGLDLHGQDLHGIELAAANLSGADLHGADLRHARFEAVDFHGANLAGAKTDGASFIACNVGGLDLPGARVDPPDRPDRPDRLDPPDPPDTP